MRILIDGHMIGSGEGGNERYIKNLFLSLSRRKEIDVTLLIAKQEKFLKGNKTIIRAGALNNLYRLLYLIPSIVKNNNVGIVHSSYIMPFYKNAKFVSTVHDISFKYYPQYFSFRERLIFRFLLPYSLKLADVIIVPTEFSKKELLKFYPQYRNKIAKVSYGSDSVFKRLPKEKIDRLLDNRFKIKDPFIFAINGKNPRKNINTIIKAFLIVQEKNQELRLVIVGGNFNIEKEYLSNKGIMYLNKVSDEELNFLYNGARIFVYLSFYEGFGLPIVEALSCGTHVICSDTEVHREVAKSRVKYVKPWDEKKLARKMERLLKSKSKVRKVTRNEEFSWEKTAWETARVYKKLWEK